MIPFRIFSMQAEAAQIALKREYQTHQLLVINGDPVFVDRMIKSVENYAYTTVLPNHEVIEETLSELINDCRATGTPQKMIWIWNYESKLNVEQILKR